MPLRLDELEKQTSTVDVFKIQKQPKELWGKLMVTYYIYPDWGQDEDAERDRIIAAGDPVAVQEINSKYCERVILSWDLQDREGNPIPVEAEAIRREVPSNIFNLILFAIGKDRAQVGPTKKSSTAR